MLIPLCCLRRCNESRSSSRKSSSSKHNELGQGTSRDGRTDTTPEEQQNKKAREGRKPSRWGACLSGYLEAKLRFCSGDYDHPDLMTIKRGRRDSHFFSSAIA